MKHITRSLLLVMLIGLSVLMVTRTNVQAGSDTASEMDPYDNDSFPRALKYLLPPPVPLLSNPNRSFNEFDEDGNPKERVAYGAVNTTEELVQPIAYSHKLHAGEMGIECEYCHTYARRSIHAGIPSTQICMNCHGDGKVSSTDKPELEKLKEYFANDEEIPWVKVHDLPDFVHFSHKRHVKATIPCQECHGQVQDEFTVGRRVKPLTMGWCLDCHENNNTIPQNYCEEGESTCDLAELRRTEIKDCATCHK